MAGASDILIANVREKGSEVTNFLEKEGINIRYTSLRLVDYLIAGRVAVIRRTVDTFLDDLSNKMVYRTAPEFKRTFPDPLYIVEGESPAGRISSTTHGRSGVTYLTFVNKIPIIFASTPEETAKYLALMMKQAEFASPIDPSFATVEEGEEDETKTEVPSGIQVQILSKLPGISTEIAKALLNKFGTLRAVLAASESDLGKVKGVGVKKAKTLSQVLNATSNNGRPSSGDRPNKASVARR